MNAEKTHTWPRRWPLAAMSVPAMLAIWSGWVGLGEMTGYGPVKILPGIADVTVNTAIALPVGVEIFAVTTMSVWFSPAPLRVRTRRTAMVLSLVSALLGLAGQVGYHVLVAGGTKTAPDWLTMFVACLPVLIVVCAAALFHMVSADRQDHVDGSLEQVAGPSAAGQLTAAATRWFVARTAKRPDSGRDRTGPDAPELTGHVAGELAAGDVRTDGQPDTDVTGQRTADTAQPVRTAANGHRSGGHADSGQAARRPVANGRTAKEAAAILADEPNLSGDALAIRLGVSGRTGRRLKNQIQPKGTTS